MVLVWPPGEDDQATQVERVTLVDQATQAERAMLVSREIRAERVTLVSRPGVLTRLAVIEAIFVRRVPTGRKTREYI